MSNPIPFGLELERGRSAIPCTCGGYCDRVECTDEERREHGCGRDRPGQDCCAVAFVCRICQKRYAGTQEAPDIDGEDF